MKIRPGQRPPRSRPASTLFKTHWCESFSGVRITRLPGGVWELDPGYAPAAFLIRHCPFCGKDLNATGSPAAT